MASYPASDRQARITPAARAARCGREADAVDGAVLGELVVPAATQSVASSADGDTIAVASRYRASMYRFDN